MRLAAIIVFTAAVGLSCSSSGSSDGRVMDRYDRGPLAEYLNEDSSLASMCGQASLGERVTLGFPSFASGADDVTVTDVRFEAVRGVEVLDVVVLKPSHDAVWEGGVGGFIGGLDGFPAPWLEDVQEYVVPLEGLTVPGTTSNVRAPDLWLPMVGLEAKERIGAAKGLVIEYQSAGTMYAVRVDQAFLVAEDCDIWNDNIEMWELESEDVDEWSIWDADV